MTKEGRTSFYLIKHCVSMEYRQQAVSFLAYEDFKYVFLIDDMSEDYMNMPDLILTYPTVVNGHLATQILQPNCSEKYFSHFL